MTDPFAHPWLGGLFGDPDTAALIGPKAQLAAMLRVEAAFTRALGAAGRIPVATAEEVARHILSHRPDLTRLRAGTASDGVVVPALVRALRAELREDLHPCVHTGLTSQDVIDTALVLTLSDVCTLFVDRLDTILQALRNLQRDHGQTPLMGRTRMQAALPISAGHRINAWANPLADHLQRLNQLKPRLLQLQLGGAAGDRATLGGHAKTVATVMCTDLDLTNPATCWHSRRDGLAEYANWLSLVTGTLGKMGQDILLMAQQGLNEITLTGGGGSSAMPHKQNPVLAELLVTLARFNATQLAGMHHTLVHEQERSGAAWSLEWMILPQMLQATGRALTAGADLINRINRIGTPAANS